MTVYAPPVILFCTSQYSNHSLGDCKSYFSMEEEEEEEEKYVTLLSNKQHDSDSMSYVAILLNVGEDTVDGSFPIILSECLLLFNIICNGFEDVSRFVREQRRYVVNVVVGEMKNATIVVVVKKKDPTTKSETI